MKKVIIISVISFIICICLILYFSNNYIRRKTEKKEVKALQTSEQTNVDLNDFQKEDFNFELPDHSDVDLIKMYFKENTFSSKKSTVIVANNSNNKNFTTSPYFRLDKFENDEWITVSDWGTQEIGLFVPAGGTIEFDIDWEKEYKELESGKYRLLKRMECIPNFTIYENLTIEFEI